MYPGRFISQDGFYRFNIELPDHSFPFTLARGLAYESSRFGFVSSPEQTLRALVTGARGSTGPNADDSSRRCTRFRGRHASKTIRPRIEQVRDARNRRYQPVYPTSRNYLSDRCIVIGPLDWSPSRRSPRKRRTSCIFVSFWRDF